MTDPRDFSIPDEPIRFRVAPDDFQAPAVIPARTLKRFAGLAGRLGDADTDTVVDALAEAFRALLPGPPGERFADRLLSNGGPEDPPPLDLQRQVMPIMFWLLEKYGLRPTQPSSASADGSTDGTAPETILSGGTDSTDGAPLADSVTI